MASGARRSRGFSFQLPNIGRKSTGLPTLKRAEAHTPVFCGIVDRFDILEIDDSLL